MKTKTLKLTAFFLIFAGAFTACNGKEYPFLNIDTTSIPAPAEGGAFQIAVSSNGAWTAVVQDAENNSWLTLANASGINDGVITVNITENLYFAARSTTVKIFMGSLSEYVVVKQEVAEIIFPIKIPFTEYSLRSTGCWWTTPPSLEVFIINNREELEKHINCAEDGNTFPEIDFSNYTLLLTNGTGPQSPWVYSICFLKTAAEKYVLTVWAELGLATVPGVWRAAILVPKMSNDADIERVVNCNWNVIFCR